MRIILLAITLFTFLIVSCGSMKNPKESDFSDKSELHDKNVNEMMTKNSAIKIDKHLFKYSHELFGLIDTSHSPLLCKGLLLDVSRDSISYFILVRDLSNLLPYFKIDIKLKTSREVAEKISIDFNNLSLIYYVFQPSKYEYDPKNQGIETQELMRHSVFIEGDLIDFIDHKK